MPWLETSSMELRARFIAGDRPGFYTRTVLCARSGISRKRGQVLCFMNTIPNARRIQYSPPGLTGVIPA